MSTCPECEGIKWNRGDYYNRDLCAGHSADSLARRAERIKKQRAGAKRRWASIKRTPAQTEWRNWCIRSVQRAVKIGWLPDLRSGEYACVDCGGMADRWEHRDYSKVLDVEPVCHKCNMARGMGKMPALTEFQKRDATEKKKAA
jgi:hypothetical protein